MAEQEPLLNKANGGDTFSRTSTRTSTRTAYDDAASITATVRPIKSSSTNIKTNVNNDVWKLPISKRSTKGPILNRLLVVPTFLLGLLAIFFIQVPVYPLWPLMRVFGDKSWVGKVYNWDVEFTKQLFGMLRESSGSWFRDAAWAVLGVVKER
jgi:hypothetical protein